MIGEAHAVNDTANGKAHNNEKYLYVTNILHRLCISPGSPGFYHVRDAILFAYDLGLPVPAVHAAIFDELVKRYQIDRRRLDRSIHSVLDTLAKTMTRRQALYIITGLEVDCVNKPFRNIEFISYMVEALHLRFPEE